MLLAAPPAGATTPHTWWVYSGATPVGSPGTGTSCTSPDYNTIQAAVDAASAGDTVIVCQATYAEDVTVAKSLTLDGNLYGQDARTRSGLETIVQSITISASNVTVDGFKFTTASSGGQVRVDGGGTPAGVLSGVVVQNNIFTGYSDVALPTYNAGNVLIQKNQFDGPASTGEAMQIKADSSTSGGCDGSQVLNNGFSTATNNGGADVNFSCTDSASSGITVSGNASTGDTGGSSFTAFSGVTGGITIAGNTASTDGSTVYFFGGVTGSPGATIENNRLTGSSGSAVSIHGNADSGTDDSANSGTFTIQDNVLTGNLRGVSVATGVMTAAGQVTVNYNDVSGNTGAGVYNGSSAITVGATDNWWGCAGGPGSSGCSVVGGSGTTTSNPWLATLPVVPTTQSATLGSTASVTATLKDNTGATVTGAPLAVMFSTSPNHGSGNVALSSGTASFSFSDSTAETVTVTATLGFISTTSPTASTLTGTATVVFGSVACSHLIYVSGSPQTAPEGAYFPNALKVQLTGCTSDPSGQHVTFTSSAPATANTTSSSALVGPDGMAQATALAGSTPGTATITASSTLTADTVAFSLTTTGTGPGSGGGALTCSHLTLVSGDNQSAPEGAYFSQALKVQLTGCNGDPSGQTISFVSDDGTVAHPTSASALVGSDGIAQVAAVAGSNPGSATIHATTSLNSDVAYFHLTTTGTGPGTGGGALTCSHLVYVSGSPQSTPRGAYFSQALKVQLTGCNGDPSGQTISFSSDNPSAANTTSSTAVVGSDGIAQAVGLAGSTVGTAHITASTSLNGDTVVFTLTVTSS